MGMTRDLWGNIKQTISWQPWGQTKKTQLYKTKLFLQINGLDLAKYHKVAHRWKAGKLDETDELCLDWGGGDGTVSTSLELLNSAKPLHLLCRQHEGHTHTHRVSCTGFKTRSSLCSLSPCWRTPGAWTCHRGPSWSGASALWDKGVRIVIGSFTRHVKQAGIQVEINTHLATAVNASSTLRPDRALVSMKGTPNSCKSWRRRLSAPALKAHSWQLAESLTACEIVPTNNGPGSNVNWEARGAPWNFLVALKDLVQKWWMCLHPYPQQRRFVPARGDDEWFFSSPPVGWALSNLVALYCLQIWRKLPVKQWANSQEER